MTITTLYDKCVDRLLEQRRERRETQRRQERDAALVHQAFIDAELAGVTLGQIAVSSDVLGLSCHINVVFPGGARVYCNEGFTVEAGEVSPPFAETFWCAERPGCDAHRPSTENFLDAVIYALDIKLEEES